MSTTPRFSRSSRVCRPFSSHAALVLAGSVATLLAASAAAQTTTLWNGSSSNNWGDPTNWTSNVVPGTPGATAAAAGISNADTALFNGTVVNLTPTLDQFYNIRNIAFGSTDGTSAGSTTAAAYTIGNGIAPTAGVVSTGPGFVLSSGGTIANFNAQSVGLVNETINAPLTLAVGAQTFNGSGLGLSSTVNNYLVIGGTVTGGAGGASALTLTGTNFVPFSNTNVNAPTVGTTAPFANTINGAIANGAGGTTSLTISGSSWALLGNNTYTGGTTITNGSVFINSQNSLGSGTAANAISFTGRGGTIFQANGTGVTLAQNISIATGATATLSTGNTTTLNGQLTGEGSFVRMGGGTTILNNALNSYSGGTAFNGNGLAVSGSNSVIQLANDSALGTGGIAFNGTAQLTDIAANGNTLTLNSNRGAITVAAGATANLVVNNGGATFVLPNAFVGSGSLTAAGAGTTILSGANNFLGATTLNGTATLKAGAGNVLGLGNLTAQTAGTILDLNGFSQYTGSLLGANTNVAGSTILNNRTDAATLTINQTGGTTFGGFINDGTGVLGLTKLGTGQLTLVQTNGYTGTTGVNQGTLLLNFAPSQVVAAPPTSNIISSSSALSLGGGTLTMNGLTGAANTQTFSGATLNPGQSNLTIIAGSTAGATAGGSTGTATLALGALTRSAGSTANFTLTSGTAGNAAITTTSGSGGGALLTSSGAAYATVASNDWAATIGTGAPFNIVSGSSVAGFYTLSTSNSLSGNADVAGTGTGGNATVTTLSADTTISSLRYNVALVTGTNASGNVVLNSGITLTTGGILGTTNIGSGNNPGISGGFLTGAGSDLPILLFSGGTLNINSVIKDNSAGALGVTRGGSTGNVTLGGLNTYSGVTTVAAGALNANTLFNGGAASSIGTSSSAATNLVLNGGSLSLNALPGTNANGTTDRLFSVGVNGGTLVSGTSGTTGNGTILNFTNTGLIGFNGQIGARTLGLSGNSTQVNTFTPELDDNGGPSSLSKAGSSNASTATWRVMGTNRYTGTTTINGGAGSLQAGTSFVQGTGAVGTIFAPTNSGGAMIGSSSLGNGTAALTFTPFTGGTPAITQNSTLDLFGTNQVVGAFSGTTSSGGGIGIVQNTTATASSLTVGNGSNANTIFTGTIINGSGGGAVSFAKNGLNVAGLTSVQIVPTAGTTAATGYLPFSYFGAATTISAGGALVLQGDNSYTGTTAVNGGTLVLDSAGSTSPRLSGTNGIAVNNGGTLLLANSVGSISGGIQGTVPSTDRINNAANLTITGGGRFSTGGLSEGTSSPGNSAALGTLTLSATSSISPAIIDFGAGANGSTLLFSLLSAASANQLADIRNWTGSSDHLLFTTASGLSSAQLAGIQFYADSGQLLGGAMEVSYNGYTELVPVPEPSTVLSGLAMLGLLGFRERRRISRAVTRRGIR